MEGNSGGFGPALTIAGDKGGLSLGMLNISRSRLIFNHARRHGGAVFINNLVRDFEQLHITQYSQVCNNSAGDSSTDGNRSGQGGAFYLDTALEKLVVDDGSSVSGNSAVENGGAFFFHRGAANIIFLAGSSVSCNRAGMDGGALDVRIASNIQDPTIDNVTITIDGGSHVTNNTAAMHGGAFSIRLATLHQLMISRNSTLEYNMAGTYGGAVYVCQQQEGSDELSPLGTLGRLTVTDDSSISFNRALGPGGAVYICGQFSGGIITVQRGSRVNNNTVSGEGALMGGGILVAGDLRELVVSDRSSISSNVLWGNETNVPLQGGGVWVGGVLSRLEVSMDSSMSWNNAPKGGSAIAVGAQEPAESNRTAELVVSGSSCICNNTAGNTPIGSTYGAIYYVNVRIQTFLVTNGSCVCSNKVPAGDGNGGAVFSAKGYGTFMVCNGSGLSDNLGGNGGALYVPDPGKSSIDSNDRVLGMDRLELCADSHMDGNQARTSGGAIFIDAPVGDIIISNSSVSNNRGLTTGGALHVRAMFKTFSIIDSMVYNNVVDFGHGGFMHFMLLPQNQEVMDTIQDDEKTTTDAKLPSSGPFFLNITRTNITHNKSIKNGGAIFIQVQHWVVTERDSVERYRLQMSRVLYVNIDSSNWEGNRALYGAGGALAFLTLNPYIPAHQRLTSVLMGGRLTVTNSTFNLNTAGDDTKRFLFINDISPLQGNGGALFIWSQPYIRQSTGPKLPSNLIAPYTQYEESSGCSRPEPGVIPAIQAFGNLSCWPSGSQSCGVSLDGVTFTSNVATGGYGGGLTLVHCAAKITRSNFFNNTAAMDGGGLAFMDYAVPQYIAQANLSYSGGSAAQPPLLLSPPWPSPLPTALRAIGALIDIASQTPARRMLLPTLGSSTLKPSAQALQNVDMSKSLQQPWLVVHNTSFSLNFASNGGGAFVEVNTTSAVVMDCDLSNNQATVQGGGIMLVALSTVARVTAVVQATNFTGNGARDGGGGLAMRLIRTRAAVVVVDSIFQDNTATRGGGIFSYGIKGTSLLAWECTMKGNTANSGGAVGLDYVIVGSSSPIKPAVNNTSPSPPPRPPPRPPSPPRPPRPPPPPPPINNIPSFTPTTAIVHFQGCRLLKNSALVNGGGISFTADKQSALTLLEQSELSENKAAALGGGLFYNGTDDSTLRISNCMVSNNSALLQGGGAYVTTKCGGQLLVGNDSSWVGNSAGQYGGAVMVNSADLVFISDSANVSDVAIAANISSQSTCQLFSLDISNSTLISNSAQKGGGVYASQDTAIIVNGTAMYNNLAWESGGAVAAVNCSLLNIMASIIFENKAAFSGGGVLADKCAILIVETSRLVQNSASTGGGVHIAGSRTDAGDVARRMLQQGAFPNGGSTNPTADFDCPVAIISQVGLTDNKAAVGFHEQLGSVAKSSVGGPPSSAFNEYQSYGGHGGALFVSGHVGVAMSGGNAGPGNAANVGSVLATTQVCILELSGGNGSKTTAEKLASMVRNWSNAVSVLSRAASLQCSLLVLLGTKLPWPMVSASSATIQQASKPKATQLPMLWLQDLKASALLVNCSARASGMTEQQAISRVVNQLLTAGTGSPPPPPSTPSRAAPAAADVIGDSEKLYSMLQACGDQLDISESQERSVALAVPANHMRLTSFSGILLVPAVDISSGSAAPTSVDTPLMGTARRLLGDGPQHLTSAANGFTFRGQDIEALIITPNTYFDLEIQLYDGLGQPAVVDTPSFEVSLSIRPQTVSAGGGLNTSKFAQLRTRGSSGGVVKQTTMSGVALWAGLDLVGWPGKYVLQVDAMMVGGPSANAALPPIVSLAIQLELLPCELGHELGESGLETDIDYKLYICSACRRDQLGLWVDRRTPLSDVYNSHASTADTYALAEIQSLLGGSDDGDLPCPSCCQVCPANAICPGGAMLIPAAGYWHSAPNSPRMHRCPQPSACGEQASPEDALDSIWSEVLLSSFNVSGNTNNITINITDASSPTVVSASPGLSSVSLDGVLSMAALRNDNRSAFLATCQQWWYANFPPSRDRVLQQQYNISQLATASLPCYLFYDPIFGVDIRDRSYMQLQCATGYTGHLCATCLPGYSLTVDFGCMECPSLARTISVGLLAFWGTVALILFTVFSNLSQIQEEEDLSSLDLLKMLITHMQYFIIITKLGIDYPAILTKYQSVLSALTGTENYIAYSPSCLFRHQDSAGQAASQITFGLFAPCMATFVTMLIWGIRYLVTNQRILHRVDAGRWNQSIDLQSLAFPQDPAELPNSISREGPLSPADSNAIKAGKVSKASRLGKTRGSLPAAAELRTTISADPPRVIGLENVAAAASLPQASSAVTFGSLNLEPQQALPRPESGSASVGQPSEGATLAPIAAAAASPPAAAGVMAAPPLAPSDSMLKSPFADKHTVADLVASSSSLNAEIRIQVDGISHEPTAAAAVADAAGGDARLPAQANCRGDIKVQLVQSPRRIKSLPKTNGPGTISYQNSIGRGYKRSKQQDATHPTPSLPLHATGYSSPDPSNAGNYYAAGPSDEKRWSQTPFAFGPPPDAQDDEDQGRGKERRGFGPAVMQRINRHFEMLVFADQALPLLRQFVVVIIVAAFILYPSVCQVALSFFACYTLDSGTGAFKENQQATWPLGYWVRNMQQQCYTGVHRRVYVPIGIASVLLFCFVPPTVYFLLTFKARHKFDDTRIKIQYGFLYRQYKPEYFWWASIRQLQVLGLVAVEVFGRALPVLQQALMLLSVLIVIAAVNTSSSPERFPQLTILEFLSMCVLSLTLTLGLYFVGDGLEDARLSTSASTAVGALILTINALFILGVIAFSAKHSVDKALLMRRAVSNSWNSLVSSVSRVIVKMELLYSSATGSRRFSFAASRSPQQREQRKHVEAHNQQR